MKTKFFSVTNLAGFWCDWQHGKAQALHIRHTTRSKIVAHGLHGNPTVSYNLFGLFLEQTNGTEIMIAVYEGIEIGKLRHLAEHWGTHCFLAVYDHHQNYTSPCESHLVNEIEYIKLTEGLDITGVRLNIRKPGQGKVIGTTCLAKLSFEKLLLLASFGWEISAQPKVAL